MQSPLSADGRYSRQERFAGVGALGQQRLREARVAVIGCGGLGAAVIDLLARSGVGSLVIVDRDVVELSNLHRQVLFEESDVERALPKAVAAAAAVGRINTEVEVRPLVADVTPQSIGSIIEGCTVVIDATDNLQTRYLINDACMKASLPWVYGGVVGSSGMAMTIVPGRTACFRCLFPDPPQAGTDTCDMVGVLASNVVTVAAHQWTEVVKLLVGATEQVTRGLLVLDVWTGEHEVIAGVERRPDCRCCGLHEYDYLRVASGELEVTRLGQHAVQVTPAESAVIDLQSLPERLRGLRVVSRNEHALRFEVENREIILFADGRAIVEGTVDVAKATALYAKYVAVPPSGG